MSVWSSTEHPECNDGGGIVSGAWRHIQAAVEGVAWSPCQRVQEELQGTAIDLSQTPSNGKITTINTEKVHYKMNCFTT